MSLSCRKRLAITALTGVACTAIQTQNGARTTQSFFNLGWTSFRRPLNTANFEILRRLLQNVAIVIIDEISFMSGAILFAINNRMKEVMGNELNFGGLCGFKW